MVDQTKFINTYIDILNNTLIEQLKSNLQLQTQIKIHEYVVAEKDQVINSLSQQLSENKVAEDWKIKYDAAEQNYSAILGKLKHMDTLLNQLNEMKRIIIDKDSQIDHLNKELDELKTSKKVINTKKKKEDTISLIDQITQEKSLDDF
jgi:hypothetical protein